MGAITFRTLKAEDVEVRVGNCNEKGCSLLLYKTARTDMALLDETIGTENWQCDYRSIDGKLFCGIGCRFKDGEWVWKWDVGVPSNMEAEKGEASDAMKRAGFKWGIGRELYTAPHVWVPSDKCNVYQNNRSGRFACNDKFSVAELEVDEGQIVKLVIVNNSNKGAVVYGGKPTGSKKPAGKGAASASAIDPTLMAAYKDMGKAIEGWCERHGVTDEREIQNKKDGVKKRPEWKSQCKSLEYIQAITREFNDD